MLHLKVIIFISFIVCLKPFSAISQNAPPAVSVSPYLIKVQQIDGTTIHIIGKAEKHVSYTETDDVYIILKNDQTVYEYAKRGSEGRLQLSGCKAKDQKKTKNIFRALLNIFDLNILFRTLLLKKKIKN